MGNSLLSTIKMVEAGYTAIYDNKEVNFYNSMTTKIKVLAAAILKGWPCTRAKLWCVSLVTIVRNENADTLLLDHPHNHDCLNLTYNVESITITQEYINSIMLQAIGWKYIHNVYEVPSIAPTVRYLHAAAEFPTKASWLKAIHWGKYNS
jgi:hypothetical protein